MKPHKLVPAALMAVLISPAMAADKTGQSGASKAETSLIDQIARDNMLEVRLGKLAEQHAASDSVKNFGKHMAADHAKAADELKAAAQKAQISLPADISEMERNKEQALQNLTGEAFDRKYMSMMVADHDKAMAALERESHLASGELKDWAQKTLQVVREHAREAKDIHGKLVAATKNPKQVR